MRTLYLFWNRLKTNFRNNSLVMILFVLGVFSSTLFLVHYYGDYVKPSSLITGLESVISNYTIVLEESYSVSDPRFERLESLGDVTYFSTARLSASDTSGALEMPEYGEYKVQARRDDHFDYDAAFGSVDLEGKTDCIVFGYADRFLDIKTLKKENTPQVVFAGETLTVLGVHNMGFPGYVSFSLFEKGTLKVDSVEILLPEYLSRNDSAQFVTELQKIFPKADIIDPYVFYKDYFKAEDVQKPMEMLKAMGLMLLSVLTFMFLVKHLFDLSMSENIVARVVGATRSDIVGFALFDVLFLSVISIILAIVVHVSLYPMFFEKIRINVNQPYTSEDYVILFLAATLTCILSCVPFLWVFWKQSVVQIKRDME